MSRRGLVKNGGDGARGCRKSMCKGTGVGACRGEWCRQAGSPSNCSPKSPMSRVGQGHFQEPTPRHSDIPLQLSAAPRQAKLGREEPGGHPGNQQCSGKPCGSRHAWEYPISTPTHHTQATV